MTEAELRRKLECAGHRIGEAVKRTSDGMILYQVDDVYMFYLDAVELANGAATLDDIVKRNNGKVFPDAPER